MEEKSGTVPSECPSARWAEVENIETGISTEGNTAETPWDEGKEESEEETTINIYYINILYF